MTNYNTYTTAQTSPIASAVSSLFSVAILVMAGVLTFAVFVNV